MDILLREYYDGDIDAISSIWNQVIIDEDGFLWNEEIPRGKVEYILSKQDVVNCAEDSESKNVVGFYILHIVNSINSNLLRAIAYTTIL